MNRKSHDSGGTDQRRKKNPRANLLDGSHKRTSRLRRKNHIQRYTPSYMQRRRCALRVPCLFAGPQYGRGLTMCATPTQNGDIISASNVGFCSSSSILGTPLPFRYVPTHLLTPEVLTRLLVSQCRRVLATCAFRNACAVDITSRLKMGRIEQLTIHTAGLLDRAQPWSRFR